MNLMRLVFFSLSLIYANFSVANATINLNDIKPVLMQRPFFAGVLFSTFDFDPTVEAIRIGAESNQHLAGATVGPYRVYARKKGQEGPFDTVIIVNTGITFLDARGRVTRRMTRARAVKETFDSIEIDAAK